MIEKRILLFHNAQIRFARRQNRIYIVASGQVAAYHRGDARFVAYAVAVVGEEAAPVGRFAGGRRRPIR